ncbi:MAG TPA: amidase [Gaiellaceae bacterium]|jgi:aspartyl-tRNA(Asn)/glutamyl-tRNA(Gln) amidotransferase subunit A|nr:amidase [Gaiellaceae bacterium]
MSRYAGRRTRTAAEAVAAADAAAARAAWIGAFWTRDPEAERLDAAAVDGAPASLRLAGMTATVKGCIDVRGLPTTWGVAGVTSVASVDAEVVRRLRLAGAVICGKSAMDQLAWTVKGDAPGFPRCANPLAPLLSAGGSSTGSAAAVAAGVVDIGIGTDLAGSVRIPAACCGVVGFKSAVGAIPFEGYDSLVPEVDTIGVLARTVADAGRAYEVVTGHPLRAVTAAPRVALLSDITEAATPEAQRSVRAAIRRLDGGVSTLRLDWRPKGLGRIFSAALCKRVGDAVAQDPARYSAEIVRSVHHGARVTEADLSDAVRTLQLDRAEIGGALDSFDAVLAPTLLTEVPSRDEASTVDGLTAATRIFSSLGWAAVAVPVGAGSPGAPPISLQIASPPGKESELFEVARRLERSA